MLSERRIIISNEDRNKIYLYVRFWKYSSVNDCEISEESVNEYIVRFIEYRNIVYDNREKLRIEVEVGILKVEVECFECAICMEDKCSTNDKVKMNCNHSFCSSCVIELVNDANIKNKDPICALCRSECSKLKVNNEETLKKFEGMMNINMVF